jgi:hypothetical protein
MTDTVTRHAVAFGSRIADFTVEEVIDEAGATQWYVDAAVRFLRQSLKNGEFRTELLDADMRRLKPAPAPFIGMLESLWGRVRSAHSPGMFVPSRKPPAFIALNLGRRKKIVPLKAGRRAEKDRPRERGKPERRRRRAPAERHCCLGESPLRTPQGSQRTTVRRLVNTDGSVGGYTVQPRPFVREATFSEEGEGCHCYCCEYREQMKGRFRLRAVPNGVWINWAPLLDLEPLPPNAGPDEIQHGIYPTENEFTDVSLIVRRDPGNPIKVGRRNDLRPREDSPWERVNQDYPTECSYWLDFYPRLFSVPEGKLLEVDATFRATIVDTCNDEEQMLPWQEWNWRFNGDPSRLAH